MGLSVYLSRKKWTSYDKGKTFIEEKETVYSGYITHNLGEMAVNAGIYKAIWRPHRLIEGYNIPENDHQAEYKFEKENQVVAKDIIPILETGLAKLKDIPEYFKKYNSSNLWGMYEDFVHFVEDYLEALKKYPDATIRTSR